MISNIHFSLTEIKKYLCFHRFIKSIAHYQNVIFRVVRRLPNSSHLHSSLLKISLRKREQITFCSSRWNVKKRPELKCYKKLDRTANQYGPLHFKWLYHGFYRLSKLFKIQLQRWNCATYNTNVAFVPTIEIILTNPVLK